ncbi:YjfA family protein, partial [Bacillus spizizenii]|nr:YjfA family protein [Bacillus spizizenii]
TKKSSNLVNANNQVIGVVELKFSSTCKTAWAKITMNNTLTAGFEA